MKKIGLLSDTHGYLHPDAFEFFKGCDEIWHAGDIMDDFILDELAAIAPTVRAVYGNCDDWDIRREMRAAHGGHSPYCGVAWKILS